MTHDIAERFKNDTAKHEMTVLHDDGLYRHLRFMQPRPGSSCYWFDLITVPGTLIFQGDGETFAFRRIEDMFAFFRQSTDGGINPWYWSEKLTSDRDSVMKFSSDLFAEAVARELVDAEKDWPGVTEAWAEHVGEWSEYNTDHEGEARRALDEFDFEPEDDSKPFRFGDTYEWQLRDFGWWFLWACHGIVWGIAQYDAARTPALAAATGGAA
jgi:hypothetical protein